MTYSPNYFAPVGGGSSRSLITNFQNGSGSTLAKATLVSVNSSGNLVPTVVDNEDLVHSIVGLTGISIPSAATGQVNDSGRLENVTTSFDNGDPLYLGKTGLLINTKPSVGVDGFAEGDFCIFVGVVAKNEFNPSLKDIKLMISVVGQL